MTDHEQITPEHAGLRADAREHARPIPDTPERDDTPTTPLTPSQRLYAARMLDPYDHPHGCTTCHAHALHELDCTWLLAQPHVPQLIALTTPPHIACAQTHMGATR